MSVLSASEETDRETDRETDKDTDRETASTGRLLREKRQFQGNFILMTMN